MELIYLYVQSFGQLSNDKSKAINKVYALSPNYHFQPEDRASDEFILKVDEKVVVPKNFFPKHVSNVSFLVGRNGSGKTTVLELLRYVLSLKDERTFSMGSQIASSRFLVIFKNEDDQYRVFSSLKDDSKQEYHPKKIRCTINGNDTYVQQLLELSYDDSYRSSSNKESYPDIATICYTPLFNLRDYPHHFNNPGYIDVSSNFLVQVDKHEEKIEDDLLAHRRADVRRALKFINRAKHDGGRWNRKSMGRFIPKSLHLSANTKMERAGQGHMRYMGLDSMVVYDRLKVHYIGYNAELISQIRKGKNEQRNSESEEKLFRLEILMAAIDGLFYVIESRGSAFTNPNSFRFELFRGSLNIESSSPEQPFIEFLERQEVIPVTVIQGWLAKLAEVQHEVEMDDDTEIGFHVPLKYGEDLLLLDGFTNLIPSGNTKKFQSIISFDWFDMSSGEKMMLDLFSRIYYAHELANKSHNQCNSICLLLDEPEVGFHPQWQREWFRELLVFTEGLANSSFNEDGSVGKKYQFIVATNNPMSLSDVPGPCVQYLGEHREAPKTFAANIHELLGDSFYLQDGFIGLFAKEKLESLIRFLTAIKARRTRLWNEENALQVIQLVGDKVIQQRLTDLYYLKYPSKLPTSTEGDQALGRKTSLTKSGT
ncbi:MAG: ATP-binding protein [Flavobacteriales bacterium]|nr:ATP-binding protein [Flavobacteriales bacterium]